MITIKLLTSPTCPYCPRAREVVKQLAEEDSRIIALELSVTTDEGLREAMKFGISGVPAIIINDSEVLLGVPRIGDLKKIVERYRYN